jgi:hypothetical protein
MPLSNPRELIKPSLSGESLMRAILSKPILLALAMTIAGADMIADDLGWSAPGWYGMAGAQNSKWIVSGPFDNQETCAGTLPADNPQFDYSCTFLNVETPL